MGEKVVGFEKQLVQFYQVALDSSCFIYHLEENSSYLNLTKVLFEKLLPEKKVQATGSTLLLTEILTKPLREKRMDLVLAYKALILSFPNLSLQALDEDVAQKAAFFRAEYSLRTPDAIHLASAVHNQAEVVIGNDNQWKKVKEIPIIVLDDFI